MQVLGLNLPPAAIALPLNISFPLHKRPSLDVTVWGRGMPDANQGPVLAIKAVNLTDVPIEVNGVDAGFIYTSLPTEVVFGSRTVRLPLRVLTGERQLPCVLQAGEAALWTANLCQLTDELQEKQLKLSSHSRYLDARRIDIERWRRRGRLATIAHNRIAMLSSRRLAVVVSDGRGSLHKAKVKWSVPWWAVLRRRRFPSFVAETDIFEDLLVIYPRGAKGVALLLDIAHVISVEADPEVARAELKKSGGSDVGTLGIETRLRSLPEGDTALFNVHDPEQTIVIGLRNERYSRLVIQVEDPTAVVATIEQAIGGARNST